MVQGTPQKYIKLLILVIRSTMQDILVFFIPPFFEPLSFSCPLSSLKNLEQAAKAQAETTKYEKISNFVIYLQSSHAIKSLFFSSPPP